MGFRFFNFRKKGAAQLQPTVFSKELIEIASVESEIGKASDALTGKGTDRARLENALQHLINAEEYDKAAIVSSHRIWDWLSNAPQEAISPTDRHMLLIFGKEQPLQIKRYIGIVRLALQMSDSTIL